jgi:uncharacterized protein YkwD
LTWIDAQYTLLDRHNTFRKNNDVAAITLHSSLSNAAQHHAEWMAENRIMSHSEQPGTIGFDAQNFVDRVKHEGYVMVAGGENIAAGQRTVDEVMDAWMASDTHRRNILNPSFWSMGAGIATDWYGHMYWCVVLARPITRETVKKVRIARVQVVVSLPQAIVSN